MPDGVANFPDDDAAVAGAPGACLTPSTGLGEDRTRSLPSPVVMRNG